MKLFDYNENAERLLKYIHDKPNEIDNLIIQYNQLRKPFSNFLSLMIGKYKQFGCIDDEAIINTLKAINKDWPRIYMNMARCEDIIRPRDFKLLQDMMIEYFQKDMINEKVKLMNGGKLNPKQFLNEVKALESFKDINEPKAITPKEIENMIRSKPNTLRFGKFRKLSNPVNVSEHDFVILSGSTGRGKTAYALNLAYDLGKNYPVLYINMEMGRETLIKRVLSNKTQIPMNHLNDFSRLPQADIDRIRNVNIEQYNVKFLEGTQTIDDIERHISKQDQSKHFIVFIDHIGLISSTQRKSRYEQLTEIAMRLRGLSLDYNCTLFGLCQLSRNAENADEPSLSLLRDSGEIEQSARKVIMLWDTENNKSIDEPSSKVTAYILKNSEGQRKEIPMMFWKTVQRFEEI